MTRLGELVPSFETSGSIRRRLLKLAYLTRKNIVREHQETTISCTKAQSFLKSISRLFVQQTHYQNARQTQNSSNTQQEILSTRERTD